MKIVEMHVEAFGKLRDFTLQVDGGLTVIYGPNEAGKSTLMGFIRAILFGFPPRSNAAVRYQPTGGGPYGGSLTLLTAAGDTLRVTRRAGDGATGRGRSPAAGQLTVTLNDGTRGAEELLLPHLGGVKGDQFRNLFAFGLDELQELRTLTGDELSGYLYSAGLGLRASSVLAAERRFSGEMEELYKPRGKNQELNRLLKTIEELEAGIRRSKADIGRYEGIAEELKLLETDIAGTDERLNELREALIFLEAAEQAHPHWLQRESVRQQLAALTDAPLLGTELAARHETLLAEQERQRAELDGLTARKLRAEAALAAEPEADEALLANRLKLEELGEQAVSYRSAVRQAEELEAELAQLSEQLDALLRSVDPTWNEELLLRCPLTLHKREDAERFRERWKRVNGQLAGLEEETAARKKLEQEAGLKEESLLKELDQARAGFAAVYGNELSGRISVLPGELQEIRREVQQALRLRNELLHLKENSRDENEREFRNELPARTSSSSRTGGARAASTLGPMERLLGVSAILCVFIPGLLVFAGQLIAAAAAAALLLGLIAYLLVERSRLRRSREDKGGFAAAHEQDRRDEGQVETLQRELARLCQRLEPRLSALSLLPSTPEAAAASEHAANTYGNVTESDWLNEHLADRLDAASNRLLEAIRQLSLHEERWQDSSRQAEQAAHSRAMAQERCDIEAQRRAELMQEWRDWLLQAFELNSALSPDSVPELFRLLEQGQELLSRKQKAMETRRFLLEQSEAFERQVGAILGDSASREPVYALRQAKERAAAAEQQRSERNILTSELIQISDQAEQLGAAAGRIEEQLYMLWQEAGAENASEFRVMLERSEKRLLLAEEQQKLSTLLEAAVGTARLVELDSLLEACGTHGLRLRMDQRRSELEGVQAQANELRDRKGRLANERDRLEQGEEHAERLQRLQEETAKLEALISRWASLAFSYGLLRQARQAYERERQPGVLQRASAYFSSMTGGRYRRVVVPVGEKRLLAELAGSGEWMDSPLLSRGTAEQLYLAMRFALADEYAKRAMLPIMMDDIFVNFDGERLSRSLEVLGTFSRQRQVLLFTCHAHMAEGCRKAIPGCQVIPIELISK